MTNLLTSVTLLIGMDKHLLILDLDETLVYGAETALERPCDFQVGPYFIYRRPHLTEFLTTVAAWFELAVWSSANRLYVQPVVEQIYPEHQTLRFLWCRERCTQRFNPDLVDYYWVKNLKKVKRLGYALERTVMIDDSPEKLAQHYGNHLRVRPFLGQPDDTELRDVLPFLAYLRDIENLRTVEKRHWRQCAGRAPT